ncbi:MAG TPA: gamma-glutamyltransferase [Bryobacterales bacterium]|nr:gamma-glutamyltransferase [Bryobacterales bacterium]
MVKLLFCSCFFLAMALAADRPAGRLGAGRSVVWARNGMVATSQPLAVQAGLQILRQGGNAVDAAVATAAVLAVVEPMSTGLGGDMFAMVYSARTGELHGLNGSGFSPRAVTRDFFVQKNLSEIPMYGPFSVTVPGTVDGWATLLDKYGTMKLAQVLAPAIEYAENGFPVSEVIAWEWQKDGPAAAGRDPEFARAYFVPDSHGGHPPAEGEVFVNKPLAATLRRIAAGGRDAFYKGEIARKIVERLNQLGWPMSLEDLAEQHSDWVEPISTTYKGYRVFELPPNGQGMAALEMLNILEGYDLKSLGFNSAPYLHLLVDAKRLAFADLDAWLADPAKARLPVEQIISKDYARKQRARIDPNHAMPEPSTGIPLSSFDWRKSHSDTVYLTVVDKDRNAVSFINSIFQNFGSSIVVPGAGIILQDRGALFTLDPGYPNCIAPHKRPFHTIIPAMVFRDNKPWLSFGVMGGDMQPQGHVQVLLNMLEFGMNVQDAGEAPRFRHSPATGLTLESGVDPQVVRDLDEMGHHITYDLYKFGGYQAIQIDWKNGTLAAGTDPRKDGCAAGW